MPKIALATSLRPEPTRPARATISPARTCSETSVNTPSRVRRSAVRIVSPGVLRFPAVRSSICLLDHRADQVVSGHPVEPAGQHVPSVAQDGDPMADPHTSSSRCETNTTRAPGPQRADDREEPGDLLVGQRGVGSSMTTSLAASDSARAISTSCWSATERPRLAGPGRRRRPSASVQRPCPAMHPPQSTGAATSRLAGPQRCSRPPTGRGQVEFLVDDRDAGPPGRRPGWPG